MKKLGLCSLALAGALALSGCNKATSNDEIMRHIENNEKTDMDYAYGLFSLAKYNIYANVNGTRDNMVYTYSEDRGEEVVTTERFYKDPETNKYYYLYEEKHSVDTGSKVRVVYESDGHVYDYTKNVRGEIEKEETDFSSIEAYIRTVGSVFDVFDGIEKDHLSKVEILDLTSFSLIFVGNNIKTTVTMTNEGRILSATSTYLYIDQDTHDSYKVTMKSAFDYTGADSLEFMEMVAAAKAQSLS